MYTITELPRTPITVCYRPRLFFSIYYKTGDHAFRYAAETWRNVVKAQESFAGYDHFVEREISTEFEFKTAWQELYQKATNDNLLVWAGQLFTHSSKQTDGNDGLEFHGDDHDNGTLQQAEIASLAKLPWHNQGFLILAGCNSGINGSRGWSPAEEFAKKQGVKTLGQVGYGYFSEVWDTYDEKPSSATTIALWAYRRGKNGALGDGKRIPAKIF
mgnify:CR=1 FL=1